MNGNVTARSECTGRVWTAELWGRVVEEGTCEHAHSLCRRSIPNVKSRMITPSHQASISYQEATMSAASPFHYALPANEGIASRIAYLQSPHLPKRSNNNVFGISRNKSRALHEEIIRDAQEEGIVVIVVNFVSSIINKSQLHPIRPARPKPWATYVARNLALIRSSKVIYSVIEVACHYIVVVCVQVPKRRSINAQIETKIARSLATLCRV